MSENQTKVPGSGLEAGRFAFYAFISYKHLDKHWAKWTQAQLEHYRLPSRLCRERNVPRHVSPIFRDETDLLGGKTIHTLLEEKIQQSKYLIVICSRHMQVEPKYIDYEIETFLAAGNPSSRILPLIVDGEANSPDPEKECLPPALKKLGDAMPLGITLNRRDKKETVLKLIASILELDLQALRAHNHDRQQRRIVAALGCGLAFSLGLGAFMTWEMLSVKQAGLREQLTFAADTFRQGDRLSAASTAQTVAEDYLPLMDGAILTEAEQLSLMAAIRPKYQPVTRLCTVSADSRLLFTTDGQHVMVITSNNVKKYDLQGREVMSFDTSQFAQQIVDVCPDGVHAVVLTTYLPELPGTRLYLWSMETDEPVCELVQSDRYHQDSTKAGYLTDVVNARFSPDGKTVCAWRDGNGGYFNESEELAAWDVQTGEKRFSFSADLLGKGSRTNEIEAFEFIGSDTLHWTGSGNHVFYTLGDSEPSVISKRAYPHVAREKNKHVIGNQRYVLAEGDTVTITDLLTQEEASIGAEGLDVHWADYNGRYLFLWATDGGDDCVGLVFIDLQTMTEPEYSAAFNEVCLDRSVTFGNHADGSPYVYLTLDEVEVYRLDMTTGDVLAVEVSNAAEYEIIAHTAQMDVLVASIGSRTHILEVEGDAIRTYTIDAEHQRFVTSAAVGSGQYMAANHNGSYYLYPLIHPGVQLDADLAFTGNPIYAASADGAIIVKGGGTTLAAWKQGTLLLYTDLPEEILITGAANDRFFALTGHCLYLYDEQGGLIAQYTAPEDRLLRSAKITADGRRIALLDGWAGNYADNSYSLSLLDGATLEVCATVSEKVHVIANSVYEAAYDLSDDGRWVSAIVRVYDPDSRIIINSRGILPGQYQLSSSVWDAETGTLWAQSQNVNNDDVPVFDLIHQLNGISSAHRLQYVHFARSGMLLSGLQYGTWVFDVEQQKTATFISEGANSDALPDMLSSGQLLYPAGGLHVWDTAEGRLTATIAHKSPNTALNAMLTSSGQNRLYVSPDQQWVSIAGAEDTWLYLTEDWSTSTVLATQPAQVLHLDETQLTFATADGLWRLEYDTHTRKENTP